MTPKKLLVLAVIAVAAVAAAVAARLAEPDRVARGEGAAARLFPGLEKRVNQVAAVTVTHQGGTFTFRRRDGRWTLAQADGYPARGAAVRRAVVTLARMERVAARTADPGRYGALHLRDPEAEGAKSRRITLLDGEGNKLAGLVVGRRGGNLGGDRAGRYVRKAGGRQAWLAEGDLKLPTRKADWLRRTVVNLKEKAIARTTLERAGGKTVTVKRGEDGFTVKGEAPADRVPDDRAIKRLGTALSDLRLKDVRKAAGMDFTGEARTTLTSRTDDGLAVTVEHVRHDGAAWVRVAEVKAPEDAKDARKRARTIRRRTDGWVYELPSYKARAFTIKRGQLFRKENEKSGDGTPGAPPQSGAKGKLMEQLQKMRKNGGER